MTFKMAAPEVSMPQLIYAHTLSTTMMPDHMIRGHAAGSHMLKHLVVNNNDNNMQIVHSDLSVSQLNTGTTLTGTIFSRGGIVCHTDRDMAICDVTMVANTPDDNIYVGKMAAVVPRDTVAGDISVTEAESHSEESKCAGALDLMMNAHDRSRDRSHDHANDGEATGRPEVGGGDTQCMEVDVDEDEDEEDKREGEAESKEVERIPQVIGERTLRHRSNRRPVHERFRQKRQTLQDMARPLKHWLYRHRANPYPTREEKAQLARWSSMTLTQVSNWFANARRRLKNTVADPGLSWGRRVQLYNSCLEGNAERLSVCSDDEELNQEDDQGMEGQGSPQHQGLEGLVNTKQHRGEPEGNRLEQPQRLVPHYQEAPLPPSPMSGHAPINFRYQDGVTHNHDVTITHGINNADGIINNHDLTTPQEDDACSDEEDDDSSGTSGGGNTTSGSSVSRKYKASILQRYLQDACELQQPAAGADKRRHPSGSLSSHDYEEWSSSSCSSPGHTVFEDPLDGLESMARHLQSQGPSDEMYFKEISAALALTSLKLGRRRHIHP